MISSQILEKMEERQQSNLTIRRFRYRSIAAHLTGIMILGAMRMISEWRKNQPYPYI